MMRVAMALIAWLALTIQSHGALRWRWSNPTPHGATIFDQTSFGSLVIHVGEFGQVYASDTLDDWIPRTTGVTNSLRSVLFFGGGLVVSASDGLILYTETDAMSRFVPVNLGTQDWIEGLALGGGRLIGVGDNGAIYTSLNASNWTRLPNAGEWLTSVAYGAGKFVAVGYEGYVITSADGLTWGGGTRLGTADLNKVVFIDNRFWILGNSGFVRISDNGLAWTPINTGTTNDLFDADTDGIEVVVVGRSELRTSVSPYLLWTNKTSVASGTPPPWTYYSVHWDGSEFMVSGRSGIVIEGFRTNITSPSFWIPNTEPARNWIWSMVNLDGVFAACGEGGGIFTSLNGFRFEQEVVPASVRDEILEGIGGTTNLLISVGTAGAVIYSPGGSTNITTTNGTERVSLLGLRWEEVYPRPTTNELQGVGYFNSLYIISGGRGTILTSPNGSAWTARNSGITTAMLSSVTASPTRAIAVGDFGSLTVSTNGTTWTTRASGFTNWIYQARYLNNQFVAVGETGLIITSPDGLTWTRRTSGTTIWLNALTYAQSNYYAVGGQGTVLVSSNSINWASAGQVTTKSFYGIAADDRRLLVAGIEGAIVRARIAPYAGPVNFTSLGREGAVLGFLFSGGLDQPFTLERSLDFIDWTRGPELEIIDDSGTLIYFEAQGRGTRTFYRTSSPNP